MLKPHQTAKRLRRVWPRLHGMIFCLFLVFGACFCSCAQSGNGRHNSHQRKIHQQEESCQNLTDFTPARVPSKVDIFTAYNDSLQCSHECVRTAVPIYTDEMIQQTPVYKTAYNGSRYGRSGLLEKERWMHAAWSIHPSSCCCQTNASSIMVIAAQTDEVTSDQRTNITACQEIPSPSSSWRGACVDSCFRSSQTCCRGSSHHNHTSTSAAISFHAVVLHRLRASIWKRWCIGGSGDAQKASVFTNMLIYATVKAWSVAGDGTPAWLSGMRRLSQFHAPTGRVCWMP